MKKIITHYYHVHVHGLMNIIVFKCERQLRNEWHKALNFPSRWQEKTKNDTQVLDAFNASLQLQILNSLSIFLSVHGIDDGGER